MIFLVLANDNTDEAARERRRAVLPTHRENLKHMIAKREMVIGGSLIDEAGARTGSIAIINLPDRAAAEAWVANHPYTKNGIWSECRLESVAATQSSIDWLPPEAASV